MSALLNCFELPDIEGMLEAQIVASVDGTGGISKVSRYVLKGGQRLRARLLLDGCERYDQLALDAAVSLELLHGATLLQDDILDKGSLRHGSPCAHLRFGHARALLASDFLLLRAIELADEVDTRFARGMKQIIRTMICAESVDIHEEAGGRDAESAALPAILHIARGKTGGLFGLALQGAAFLSSDDRAFAASAQVLGAELGVTYQMLDDARDVYVSSSTAGKDVGCDLMAGRLTVPVLYAVEHLATISPANRRSPHVELPSYRALRRSIASTSTAKRLEILEAARSAFVRRRFGQWARMRLASHRQDALSLRMQSAVFRWENRLRPVLDTCCPA